MVDAAHKGREFPPFEYVVERGKLREFLIAIGDGNDEYSDDNTGVPPTFPTVFAFWGGMSMEGMLHEIGVEMWNVLHGEQEYEYLAPVHVGDTISGRATVSNVYSKAGLDFVEIQIDYLNQSGNPVVRERALIIVRENKA